MRSDPFESTSDTRRSAPGQEEVVRAVLDDLDVPAVMLTESSRSLGCPLPAVVLPGITDRRVRCALRVVSVDRRESRPESSPRRGRAPGALQILHPGAPSGTQSSML